MYQHIKVPASGQKITVNADMSLNVPDEPVIPYIEGDGTGFDITPVMIKVVDAAVQKALAEFAPAVVLEHTVAWMLAALPAAGAGSPGATRGS